MAGGIMMLLALTLFSDSVTHLVAISFSALILNELLMVAFTVQRWYARMHVLDQGPRRPNRAGGGAHRHRYMVYAETITLFVYMASMAFLPEYFGVAGASPPPYMPPVACPLMRSCPHARRLGSHRDV
jgi:phospholipid-translocating ATPase